MDLSIVSDKKIIALIQKNESSSPSLKNAYDLHSLYKEMTKRTKNSVKKGGLAWKDVKDKLISLGKTTLKVALPILTTAAAAYGFARYKMNQFKDSAKKLEQERQTEQQEIERQQREIREQEQWKNMPHSKPSAEPVGGSKPIAFHFPKETMYDTPAKRLRFISKFYVKPSKKQHKTPNYFKYRIDESNPKKKHITKKIHDVNIIFELQ